MYIRTVLILAIATITIMAAPTNILVEPLDVDKTWADWKTEHNRTYKVTEEEAKRFEIFKDNLKKITEHNKKYLAGETTWTQGLNNFADLTQEEFSQSYLGGIRKPQPEDANATVTSSTTPSALSSLK